MLPPHRSKKTIERYSPSANALSHVNKMRAKQRRTALARRRQFIKRNCPWKRVKNMSEKTGRVYVCCYYGFYELYIQDYEYKKCYVNMDRLEKLYNRRCWKKIPEARYFRSPNTIHPVY